MPRIILAAAIVCVAAGATIAQAPLFSRDTAYIGAPPIKRSHYVQNDSSRAVPIVLVEISGADSADYRIDTVATPIPPQDSNYVRFAFAPTTPGRKSAAALIYTTSSGINRDTVKLGGFACLRSLTPSSRELFSGVVLDIGDSSVESICFNHPGNCAVVVDTEYLAGDDAKYFKIARHAPSVINPGDSVCPSIRFTAQVRQDASSLAEYVIKTNAIPLGTYRIALSARGGYYCQSFSPDVLFAGPLPNVGETGYDTLYIQNCGDLDFDATVVLTGPDANEFGVVGPTNFKIKSHWTDSAVISFTPATHGPKTVSLDVATDNPHTPSVHIQMFHRAGVTSTLLAARSPSGASITAVYPDPARTSAAIPIMLERAGRARIDLVDPLGRIVRAVLDARLGAGTTRASLDVSRLGGGIYFLRLVTEFGVATRPIRIVP